MFSDERERPLLLPKRGAFLYPDFGPLAVAAVRGKHRHVGIDPQRVVPPVAGGDHAPVEVEDPLELLAIERSDWAPVPGTGERRNDAQALLTFG